jgi:hypothetical protein
VRGRLREAKEKLFCEKSFCEKLFCVEELFCEKLFCEQLFCVEKSFCEKLFCVEKFVLREVGLRPTPKAPLLLSPHVLRTNATQTGFPDLRPTIIINE